MNAKLIWYVETVVYGAIERHSFRSYPAALDAWLTAVCNDTAAKLLHADGRVLKQYPDPAALQQPEEALADSPVVPPLPQPGLAVCPACHQAVLTYRRARNTSERRYTLHDDADGERCPMGGVAIV